MEGCDLGGANLTWACCFGAFFAGTYLNEYTIFHDANLQMAYFDVNEDYYDDVSYDAGEESGYEEEYDIGAEW